MKKNSPWALHEHVFKTKRFSLYGAARPASYQKKKLTNINVKPIEDTEDTVHANHAIHAAHASSADTQDSNPARPLGFPYATDTE
jgi:3-phenylpropionate/cinnamic acid dioxygenase small subunit